jgi:D-apiose dehydrogenase
VRLAAERGIDVLCQKPLAPTCAEAEALVRDTDGRIRLMVHENRRFRPYYRRIAAWANEGALGTLTSGSIAVRSSGLLPDADGRYALSA